jgi:hypothetical protein
MGNVFTSASLIKETPGELSVHHSLGHQIHSQTEQVANEGLATDLLSTHSLLQSFLHVSAEENIRCKLKG